MPERPEQSPAFDARALARELLEHDMRTARQIRGDRALARLLPTRDERRSRSAEPSASTGDALTGAMRELREFLRRLFRRGGPRSDGQGTDAGQEVAQSPGDSRAPETETMPGTAPGLGATPPEEERRQDRPNLFRRARTALGDLWSLARTLADRRKLAETPPYARYEKLDTTQKMDTDKELADLIKTERRYENAYDRNDLPISGALAGNTEEAPQVDFRHVGTDLSAEQLLAVVDQRLRDDFREVGTDLSAEQLLAVESAPQVDFHQVGTDLSAEQLLAVVNQRLGDASVSRTPSANSDQHQTATERDRERVVSPSPTSPQTTANPNASPERPVSPVSALDVANVASQNVAAAAWESVNFLSTRQDPSRSTPSAENSPSAPPQSLAQADRQQRKQPRARGK